MVDYEESIYNLIPKEQYVAPKPKRYRSQYPPNLAPTASTFGLKTTSKPVCSNLSGKYNLEGGAHSHQAAGGTMGAAKGTLRPDVTTFRKKGTGNPVLIPKKEGKSSSRLTITHSLDRRPRCAFHYEPHFLLKAIKCVCVLCLKRPLFMRLTH